MEISDCRCTDIFEGLQLMEENWQSLLVIPETNGNLLLNIDEFSSISPTVSGYNIAPICGLLKNLISLFTGSLVGTCSVFGRKKRGGPSP